MKALAVKEAHNGFILEAGDEQGVFESSDGVLRAVERWLLDPKEFSMAASRGRRDYAPPAPRRRRWEESRSLTADTAADGETYPLAATSAAPPAEGYPVSIPVPTSTTYGGGTPEEVECGF